MGKKLQLQECETRQKSAGKRTFIAAAASVLALGSAAAIPGAISATNGGHGDDDKHHGGVSATYTEGEGYPTMGNLAFQAEGRAGNSNANNPLSGDWELGVGTNTQASGQFSQEQYDWTSGENEMKDFTVTYDGEGQATMEVEDGTSTSFDVGEVREDSSLYIVGANQSNSFVREISLQNLTLNGERIEAGTSGEGAGNITLGSVGANVGYITVNDAELEDGFTVSGQAMFTNNAEVDGSEQALQVQVRDNGQQDDGENGSGDESDDENNGDEGNGDEITDGTEAPLAKVTSPEQNATLSGKVDINATVRDENPDHYYLKISDAEGNKVFANTYQQEEVLENDLVHEFDTTQVEDGEYEIYLAARDAEGNKDGDANNDGESTDRVNVTVNNAQNGGGDDGQDDGSQDGDNGHGNNGPGGDPSNPGNGNGNENGNSGNNGNEGDGASGDNQNRNQFSRIFVQIRGNVENLFLSINNFFGFRF